MAAIVDLVAGTEAAGATEFELDYAFPLDYTAADQPAAFLLFAYRISGSIVSQDVSATYGNVPCEVVVVQRNVGSGTGYLTIVGLYVDLTTNTPDDGVFRISATGMGENTCGFTAMTFTGVDPALNPAFGPAGTTTIVPEDSGSFGINQPTASVAEGDLIVMAAAAVGAITFTDDQTDIDATSTDTSSPFYDTHVVTGASMVAVEADVIDTPLFTASPVPRGGFAFFLRSTPDDSVNYNCDCDDETGYENLGQLRSRLMVRLGYAAQASNPPPGMAALLNDFIVSAQRKLYMKYKELRTERFFTWTMEEGVRLYDLPANEEECTKRLNALKLTWVGVEDLNGTWYPLVSGIDPSFYTSVMYNGLPARYEIRQCIEVFPPPDQAYKLRIKGHYKLQAMTVDADTTTIDSELVFLWALADAKAHYGQDDAQIVRQEAMDYLKTLVGGAHGTKRYVPGAQPAAPWTQPRMTEFDN